MHDHSTNCMNDWDNWLWWWSHLIKMIDQDIRSLEIIYPNSQMWWCCTYDHDVDLDHDFQWWFHHNGMSNCDAKLPWCLHYYKQSKYCQMPWVSAMSNILDNDQSGFQCWARLFHDMQKTCWRKWCLAQCNNLQHMEKGWTLDNMPEKKITSTSNHMCSSCLKK